MKKVPILVMAIIGVSLIASGCNYNQGTDYRSPSKTGYYNSLGTNRESNVGFRGDNTAIWGNTGFTGYDNRNPHIGFVQVNRDQLRSYSAATPMKFDKTALANSVTQALSSLPGIAHATVLVTDDHVYIGYEKDNLGRTGRTGTMNRGTTDMFGTRYSGITNGTTGSMNRGTTDIVGNRKAGMPQTGTSVTDDMVYKSAKSVVPAYYKIYVSTDKNLTRQVARLISNRTNKANIDDQLDRLLGIRTK